MSAAKNTDPELVEQYDSLEAALIAAQREIPAVKKDKTAHVQPKDGRPYKYNYADLYDMLAVGLPWLAKHGLGWSSKPTLNADGKFVLVYRIFHGATRQEDVGEYTLPTSGTPQAVGAAITYAKRQAFSAVTGIVADEDNDAHDGTETQTGYQRQNGHRSAAQRPTEQQAEPEAPSGEDTPQAARTVVKNRAKAMRRNYADLAAEYQRRTGTALDDETRPGWIRKFIEGLDSGTVKIGEAESAGASS